MADGQAKNRLEWRRRRASSFVDDDSLELSGDEWHAALPTAQHRRVASSFVDDDSLELSGDEWRAALPTAQHRRAVTTNV